MGSHSVMGWGYWACCERRELVFRLPIMFSGCLIWQRQQQRRGLGQNAGYALVGKRIGAFVFGVPCVSAHPLPLDLVLGGKLV